MISIGHLLGLISYQSLQWRSNEKAHKRWNVTATLKKYIHSNLKFSVSGKTCFSTLMDINVDDWQNSFSLSRAEWQSSGKGRCLYRGRSWPLQYGGGADVRWRLRKKLNEGGGRVVQGTKVCLNRNLCNATSRHTCPFGDKEQHFRIKIDRQKHQAYKVSPTYFTVAYNPQWICPGSRASCEDFCSN